MGLLRRLRDPVRGTARVVAIGTPGGGNATWENTRMQLLVTAPGVSETTVTHRCLVRVDRWPRPGDSLAVTVDRDRPDRLRIDWDEAPGGRTPAQARGDQVADALRRQGLEL
jgi:hypothetical protein